MKMNLISTKSSQILNKVLINNFSKKFSSKLLNTCKQSSSSFTVNSYLFKNKNNQNALMNSFSMGLPRRNFFSQNEKSKENEEESEKQAEKPTEKKNEKVEKEDKEESSITNEKYKELREMYADQTKKMEQLKKKFEELRNAYLSNVDETEQIKKRNEREVANTKEFAISKFAKDMLDVHDNFDRAFNAIGEKEFSSLSEEEKNEIFNNFLEGIKITHCGLTHILKRHGIVEYNPIKEKFDPNKHEAVFDYEDETMTPGSVGQVMQTGFKIGERILRPAKVGVIKKK